MDLGLAGKRVMVTGGTRGIGLATARVFAAEGALVSITYHSAQDVAEKVVDELGGPERAHAVRYSLGDPASVAAAVAAVEERWGGIDALVANALWFTWSDPSGAVPFERVPAQEWQARLRANVDGTVLTVQRALAGMRERRWGRVVLMSSITARRGLPGSETYSAAKGALHGFAKGLMWTRDGVLVNVVSPGATLTESSLAVDEALLARETAQTPSGRLSEPEEVARLVVFLCSAANGNINGEIIHTAGGR